MGSADAHELPTTLGVLERALFDSAPPVTIGRFEIVRQLGRGGMGVVYTARDPTLERDVAIKVHRGDRTGLGDARLRREAQSLAQLRHRNVVSVFEVGESDSGEVFVVMEHLVGPTLRRFIADTHPSATRVLDVFIRCARGLQAAHDAGLVHRDFKPDNVIIDSDGEPRIIDFGLARVDATVETEEIDDREEVLTRDGVLVGTPRYMAPELRNGEPPTPRSDQFAFAVALFEAIAGAPPFTDERYQPAARPNRMPRRWWPLVERAFDPLPAQRWPSMGQLADRLAAELAPRSSSTLKIAGAVAGGAAIAAVGSAALQRSDDAAASSVELAAASSTVEPCEPGTELLDGTLRWSEAKDLRVGAGELAIDFPAGPKRLVSTQLAAPGLSFRDRAIEFELERLPARDTPTELFLGLSNGEDEEFSVLVWGGAWVFPMAPNTHELALAIDRERDRFFRIQVQDQRTLPDIVTFEYSSDGAVWIPIARVEGSLGSARLFVSVGSHDPVLADDRVVVRSIKCTELQPVAEMPEERNRAREELPSGDPPLRR
ncbi:MAG TPA: serine/threonine-protein kinase [Nannocystaceae bacterium]|nr:serine/threonine-protein kinase [Nannocystaceae bacterium]